MPYKYPYGRNKGKLLSECDASSLKFYVKNLKLGNPKYDSENMAMAKECVGLMDLDDLRELFAGIDRAHAAYNLCSDILAHKLITPAPKKAEVPVARPHVRQDTEELLKSLRAYIKILYDTVLEMQSTTDVFEGNELVRKNNDGQPF